MMHAFEVNDLGNQLLCSVLAIFEVILFNQTSLHFINRFLKYFC